jgi:toxin HigB-1
MIRTIRHKGLNRLYEDDDPRDVIAGHADKLRDILARLDAVLTVADMDVPGLRLHPLKGREKGFWEVTVRANWRVIFRFADHDAFDAWIITEKETNHADEEPTPPRRLCIASVH